MGNLDFKIGLRVFLIFDPFWAKTAYWAYVNAGTD